MFRNSEFQCSRVGENMEVSEFIPRESSYSLDRITVSPLFIILKRAVNNIFFIYKSCSIQFMYLQSIAYVLVYINVSLVVIQAHNNLRSWLSINVVDNVSLKLQILLSKINLFINQLSFETLYRYIKVLNNPRR